MASEIRKRMATENVRRGLPTALDRLLHVWRTSRSPIRPDQVFFEERSRSFTVDSPRS